MPRTYLAKHVVHVLEHEGFFFVSQNGSHAKYRKIGNPTLTVVVPMHRKEIPHGTFRSILRQSQLNESDFQK